MGYHLKQLHNLKESEEQHPHTPKPVHKSLGHFGVPFLQTSIGYLPCLIAGPSKKGGLPDKQFVLRLVPRSCGNRAGAAPMVLAVLAHADLHFLFQDFLGYVFDKTH